MNKLIILLLLIVVSLSLFAVDKPVFVNHGERYFTFQINDRTELLKLTRMISIDNVKDRTVFAYANQQEWDAFNKLDYKPTLLPHPGTLIEPEMASNDRDIWAFDTYPTYDQYVTMMNTFASNYPNLCQIYELGTLASGRKILFAHISSNVGTPAAKPEVQYTSTMHGDETTGYIMMLHLINELLSKYGIDQRLTNMVNNLDIWINPCANPDGTYAGGNNTVSSATRGNANGVDLNRNFRDPITGYPSTQQPETLLFQNFADTHHFVQVANFHGGAEVVNYPWDGWTSSQKTHPDNNWFLAESRDYADSVHLVSPSTYMNFLNNGVTNGGDWYIVYGGRQDYTNYFAHGREITIEVSDTKLLPAAQLLTHWSYNYKSLLKYLEKPYYAIRGTVTTTAGTGIAATVTVNGHDADNSQVITDPAFGDYYRMIEPGTWSLTFSAEGYQTVTYNNVVVTANTPTYLNVVMQRQMNPPSNVQAFGGNHIVLLTWTVPTPPPGDGFKIYRNAALLTTVPNTATSYSDHDVMNGTTYSYNLVSVYTGPPGESAASTTVDATPSAAPPTNLAGVGGNAMISLTWSAPAAGTPSGYMVYRNSVLMTPTPLLVTNYTDSPVVNGATYSYYVTALYSSPFSESSASNTVNVTPNATSTIPIGTGTLSQSYPLDRYYNYSAYETIYLQGEISIAGTLSKMGFYKASGTDIGAISDVTIYVMHTTATTLATGTYSLVGYTQVYSGSFTNDGTTGWMEVTLTTPFVYNNTNNLQVLIVKGYQSYINNYPMWRYTSTSTNFRTRFNHNDTAAPTSLTRSYNRANTRLTFIQPVPNPAYVNNQSNLDFGTVPLGQTSLRSFTITNNGGGNLTGNITTPTGFTVAPSTRGVKLEGRNTIAYNVIAGSPATFNVTFEPALAQAYSGDITITSSDPVHPTNTLPATGIGEFNPLTEPAEVEIIQQNGDFLISWESVLNALSYHVYRATTPDGSYTEVAEVTTNSYLDTDTSGREHFYYITAE